jgi:phospholipid/cholesterol/gamma-HCH transport system permease protein
MADAEPTLREAERAGQPVLEASGVWTVFSIRDVQRLAIRGERTGGIRRAGGVFEIDASKVGRLDTAGALEILTLAGAGPDTKVTAQEGAHADLFKLVQANMRTPEPERPVNWLTHALERIGYSWADAALHAVNLCEFFGEVVVTLVRAIFQPRRFRINAIVRQMFEVWLRALTIVGILCFLIGVVLAYQSVQQLRAFGAETFSVEAVAIAIGRELGVLLTAIIVAGRSGSAFTAQIGTMQVNLEVDAMRTMGLNPIEWLVLPRIMALTLSMPLLAFWGVISGLLGGAFACSIYLDFTVAQFFERLRDTVGIWNFYTGMIKAPVFGFIIAAIGCYEGLQVTGSAESVGRLTTKSVVESIFFVIVLDAIFSIIFLFADV